MVLSLISARFIQTLLRPASGKPLTICRCTRKTIRLIKYSAGDVLVGLPAIPPPTTDRIDFAWSIVADRSTRRKNNDIYCCFCCCCWWWSYCREVGDRLKNVVRWQFPREIQSHSLFHHESLRGNFLCNILFHYLSFKLLDLWKQFAIFYVLHGKFCSLRSFVRTTEKNSYSYI